MLKNTAGQKWRVYAFNPSTGVPVEDDEANITAKLTKDYGAPAALTDVNPTQDADKRGYYWFDLTQAETNADHLAINPDSTTGAIQVLGDPPSLVTRSGVALSGAYAITVAVDDGTDPVEGAKVRFSRPGYEGVELTDAAGQALFALDAGTWNMTITATGFVTYAAAVVVSADATVSVSLTSNAMALPPDAPVCRLDCVVRLNGVPVAGAKVKARLRDRNSSVDGVVLSTIRDIATTDANGYCYLELIRPSGFTDGDGVYIIEAYHEATLVWSIAAMMPEADTANVEDLTP